MTEDIKLVVQSDDFGMEYSVNEGIERAFKDGILTQASMMVACPWFGDAVRRAKEHEIPVGVHLMLTSEWRYYRWGPVTPGESLTRSDGTFSSTIPSARDRVADDEAIVEFAAQVETLRATGLDPCYFDCHMDIVRPRLYVETCERFGKPFTYPIGEVGYPWTSHVEISKLDTATKEQRLIDHINALGPGDHIVVSHCAVDSPQLRAMTDPDAHNYEWLHEIRLSDQDVICSSNVREAIEDRGIELCSVRDL